MSVRGDFAKLTAWERKVSRLADPIDRAMGKSAIALRKDVSANFDKSVSPYGDKLAKRLRPYSHKLLLETLAMRHGWRVRVAGKTIEFFNVDGREIAKFHQEGTRFMVARPVAPNKRGMPERYNKIINDNIVAELSRELNGLLGAG